MFYSLARGPWPASDESYLSFAIWDLISQDPTTKELTAFHADLNRQSGSAPTAIMQAHLLHASPDGHGDSSDLTLTVQFGSSAPAPASAP